MVKYAEKEKKEAKGGLRICVPSPCLGQETLAGGQGREARVERRVERLERRHGREYSSRVARPSRHNRVVANKAFKEERDKGKKESSRSLSRVFILMDLCWHEW